MCVQSTEATFFCMCILLRYASPKRGLSVAGPIGSTRCRLGYNQSCDGSGERFDSQPLQVAFILPKEYQLLVAPNLVARTSNSYVAPKYSRYRSAIPHCKHIFFRRDYYRATLSKLASNERGTINVSNPPPTSVRYCVFEFQP